MTNHLKLRHRMVPLEAVRELLEEVGRDLTASAGTVDPLDKVQTHEVEAAFAVLDVIDDKVRGL